MPRFICLEPIGEKLQYLNLDQVLSVRLSTHPTTNEVINAQVYLTGGSIMEYTGEAAVHLVEWLKALALNQRFCQKDGDILRRPGVTGQIISTPYDTQSAYRSG